MSIEKRILNDLKKGKRITQADALRDYCTSRLGGAIFSLRQQGHDIKTTIKAVKCRDKHVAHIAEYSL
jgi:hypothetical protein